MATPVLKSWTPTTTYEFKLIIEDQDYSNDLVRLSISSDIGTPYQNVTFEVFLDPTDLITNKIYGESKIKLTIILKGELHTDDQRVDMELMFLRIKAGYTMQRSSQTQLGEQIERQSIVIETLVRDPYTTMNTQLNSIYYAQTPYDIISNLVNQVGAKIEYDTNNRNNLVIDQFLIPPSTLYRTILYLDRTYGVFNGDLSVNCFFDNTVRIQNLSKKIQTDQALTIYQLATDIDQTKILQSNDPTHFYTKAPVEVTNRGNSIITSSGTSLHYIVKPRNSLYSQIDLETDEVVVTNGISDKRQTIKYDKEAIQRSVFHTEQTGYDTNEVFAIASLTKSVEAVATVSIQLAHNLPILNLMKVGSSVNFISQISDYKPLGGMYILQSSDIGWNKDVRVWSCWAKLNMIRSNITVN